MMRDRDRQHDRMEHVPEHAEEAMQAPAQHNGALDAAGMSRVRQTLAEDDAADRPDLTAPKQLTTVTGYEGPIQLESSAAAAYEQVVAAARAAGFKAPLFELTSGYRS